MNNGGNDCPADYSGNIFTGDSSEDTNLNQCDNSNLYTSCVANFSSRYTNGTNAGTFNLNLNNATSNSNANIGSHVMYV